MLDDTPDPVEAYAALRHLSDMVNAPRAVWIKLMAAFKDAGGHYEDFDAWSSTGHTYDQKALKRDWDKLKVPGKVTAGSLYGPAIEAGFKRKRSKPLNARQLADQAAAREKARAAEAAEKLAAQTAAAERAAKIWSEAQPPIDPYGHKYLKTKGVQAHGLRVGSADSERIDKDTGEVIKRVTTGLLFVPVVDRKGKLHSLQLIYPGGKKLHLADGAVEARFHAIGKPQTRDGKRVFILGEGYATCASVHEATGHIVLCCFDAGNIGKVATVLRQRQPDATILFAADNDLGREDGVNTGVLAALAAAKAVGGLVAIPPPRADAPKAKIDFNDLHQAEGLEAVAGVIDAALAGVPLGPELEPEPEAEPEWPAPAPVVQPAPDGPGEASATLPTASRAHAWDDPVDPFGIHKPPPVPMDVLPHAIAAYAADQAALMGIDPSFIAMPAIVAAASVIHDGIKLQPKRNDPTWLESARLWVALVGDPSTMKSPAISKATRHVRSLDAKLAEQNQTEYARWREKHDDWKVEKKKDRDAPEPKVPPKLRLVVEDSTVEALSEVLKDNDRGVLCVRDELSGWIGSMDSYKASGAGADRAAWLETYNGGPRSIDRVTRGSIHVKNWSVCMVGGIQPDTMRRIAKNIGGDGLLQRFMPIIATLTANVGEDRAPDREAMEAFSALFDQLAGIAPGKQAVTMTEAAHQARDRIERHAKLMSAVFDNDHMRAWLGKWNGLFARLVLTFHVIECAEAHVHPSAQQVSGETAEKVERLMCGVLLHHAIHFYTNVIDAHDRQEHIRQLARLMLAKKWSRMTMRDIAQQWKVARKLEQWETRAVVDSLVTMGWLEPDVEDIGLDRKPRSWDVNPAVHDRFTQQAEEERLRRKQAAQTLLALKATYSAGQDDSGEAVE